MPIFERKRRGSRLTPAGSLRGKTLADGNDLNIEPIPSKSGSFDRDFRRVQKSMVELSRELGIFSAECTQLGRSYALMVAARDLRSALEFLMFNFLDNVATLSPGMNRPLEPNLDAYETPVRSLPDWLRHVGEAFEAMRDRLDEFREYTEESRTIKMILSNLSRDLRYRAGCMEELDYPSEFRELRLYIHDISVEILDDIEHLTKTLKFFNQYGLPAMKSEQGRETEVVVTVSTVSTFFAAVTITALQVSLAVEEQSHLIGLVNTFWFCSLVMSIGAALNSILAVVWKRTPYGSRGRRLPLSITVWIHASPPLFLAISISCFFAGLGLYSYAVYQPHYTQVVILASTAVSSFGLITTIGWLGYEVYVAPLWLPVASFKADILSRKGGRKDPPVKQKATKDPAQHRSRANSISHRSDGSTHTGISSMLFPVKLANRLQEELLRKPLQAKELFRSRSRQPNDPEAQDSSHPTHQSSAEHHPSPMNQRNWKSTAKKALTQRWASDSLLRTLPTSSTSPQNTGFPSESTLFPFSDAVASVKRHRNAHRAPDSPLVVSLPYGEVYDIEFFAPSQLLAVACYDPNSKESLTMIYSMNSSRTPLRYKSPGSMVRQVTWSPDGSHLLARHDHHYDIINSERGTRKEVKRHHSLEACVWLHNSEAFLSAERSVIFKISLHGEKTVKLDRFQHHLIRDLALVPNTSLILVACRVARSGKGNLEPTRRAEKRIIMYDIDKGRTIGDHLPLLNDIRHISVSSSLSADRQGYDLFFGWRHQGQLATPIHYSLRPRISGTPLLQQGGLQPRLNCVGRADFLGDNHHLIAYSSRDGNVEVVDRESEDLIYTIPVKAPTKPHHRRTVAFSPTSEGSETYWAATADSKEVKIWTVNLERRGRISRTNSA